MSSVFCLFVLFLLLIITTCQTVSFCIFFLPDPVLLLLFLFLTLAFVVVDFVLAGVGC